MRALSPNGFCCAGVYWLANTPGLVYVVVVIIPVIQICISAFTAAVDQGLSNWFRTPLCDSKDYEWE